MSATDELRRLLDERGVEHMDFNMPERSLTLFAGDEHDGAYTENSVDTILTVYGASPEQAVEATLGRGTCEVVSKLLIEGEYVPAEYYEFEMECGEGFKWDESEPPHYCPNCGRKVVDA